MLWILIGYMFLFIHRPFELWPALGVFHLERIYMAGTLLAVALWPGKRWTANCLHAAFAAFALAVLVCWLASTWAAVGQVVVENYFKTLVFYVLIILVVHEEHDLRRLVFAFLVIMAVYMSHSLREFFCGRYVYRMGIVRMIGIDESLGDPNAFGASIVYSLPFLTPFWVTRPWKNVRAFLVGYFALALVCIGLTGSRSALVGLVVWVLLTVGKSQARWRWGVLALMLAPFLWLALPAELQNRFKTIIHPEVGPASAQASAEGRFEGLFTGWRLLQQYPLTGCGPGAWIPASGSSIESHNLYGQVMGEMGLLGIGAFMAMLACFGSNWRRMRRFQGLQGSHFARGIVEATGLAIVLLLFEGNFSHNLYRFNWLWFGGFLIVACSCLQREALAQHLGAWQRQVALGFQKWGMGHRPSLPAKG
jgi:O-antigen ligase